MNLVLRREESELCAFIRLEGDFEIRDEKHYCKKENATETNKQKIGIPTCIDRKFSLSANQNLTSVLPPGELDEFVLIEQFHLCFCRADTFAISDQGTILHA